MSQPFRFRHVHEIVGGFVIAILLLLIAGVIAAGNAQRWFERQEVFRIRFPADGASGLQHGAEVRLLGTPIGTLSRIEVEEDGSMEGVIRIRKDFARFIREGSEAVIKKKFAVAGDSFLEITVGTGPALVLSDATYIPCRKDAELIEMVEDLLAQVRTAIVPMLEELNGLVQAYRRIGEGLEAPDGEMRRILGHVESLLAGLERGEGTAGGLLKDPALLEQVGGILGQVSGLLREVETVLQKVQGIVEDVQKTVGALPVAADALRDELRDVPGVVLQTRGTLREADTLLVGLQNHWLLRGAMEPKEPVAARSVHEALPPPAEEK